MKKWGEKIAKAKIKIKARIKIEIRFKIRVQVKIQKIKAEKLLFLIKTLKKLLTNLLFIRFIKKF